MTHDNTNTPVRADGTMPALVGDLLSSALQRWEERRMYWTRIYNAAPREHATICNTIYEHSVVCADALRDLYAIRDALIANAAGPGAAKPDPEPAGSEVR